MKFFVIGKRKEDIDAEKFAEFADEEALEAAKRKLQSGD